MPYVRISNSSPDGIASAFAAVKGAKKQEMLLLALLQLSGVGRPGSKEMEVSRQQLLEKSKVSGAILLAALKKGIIEITKKSADSVIQEKHLVFFPLCLLPKVSH